MTNPKSTGQRDDNQDDLGRDVNDAASRPGDKPADSARDATEVGRKVGLERPFKTDTGDSVSGGFNQKR